EIAVTRPDPKVVTKADHTAKQKTSTGPEISINVDKRTRSSQKVFGTSSSGLAARDGVEQTNDGTLNNDDKEVEAHDELSRGVRRALEPIFTCVSEDASSPAQEAMPALDTQPLDADAGVDEISSDGNVDPYYEAQVSNTARDVLERDLLPFVLEPYYITYPYDEGSGKLYKDPKVCRTALDRFPTPAETHQLRGISLVELSDQMSVLQCQLITHKSMLNASYDHSLRNVERLSKYYVKQTQTIKKQRADFKQQSESNVHANEEVSRKYRNERDALAIEKEKIEEELVGTKSQLEHHKRQVEEIQDSTASFFQSDFTSLVWKFLKSEFRGLSQKVAGFIHDAKEKFDRVIAAFPDTTFPFLDKTSFVVESLRANTHIRHSTSSSQTFGHTSTHEHLKKKKKVVKKGGPSAA
nr:hypothetical protein [Tanacetum cinerariifolium]